MTYATWRELLHVNEIKGDRSAAAGLWSRGVEAGDGSGGRGVGEAQAMASLRGRQAGSHMEEWGTSGCRGERWEGLCIGEGKMMT